MSTGRDKTDWSITKPKRHIIHRAVREKKKFFKIKGKKADITMDVDVLMDFDVLMLVDPKAKKGKEVPKKITTIIHRIKGYMAKLSKRNRYKCLLYSVLKNSFHGF